MDIDCTHVFKETTRGQKNVALVVYRTLGDIVSGSLYSGRKGLEDVKLNSFVLSGTNGTEKRIYLSKPVFLTLKHTQPVCARTRLVCASWKRLKEAGSWSTEGCSHVESNDSHTKCQCDHLPSFAVVLALTPKAYPGLAVITRTGLVLSLLCLFLAILTFCLCRSIQNTSTPFLLQLSICLFLVHLLFLVGIDQTEPAALCSVIAGALHYLYLASFTWILLEGLHLFFTIRNLKAANDTSTGRFKKSVLYPLGYGIPAVIVAVSVGLGHKNYGTNTRVLALKAIVQLLVLSCSWSLGFFMIEAVEETAGLVIAYMFTTISVLQGVLLFMLYCLLNHQVRMKYKKWFSRMWREGEMEGIELSCSKTHKMEEPDESSQFVPEGDTEATTFA